MKQKSIRVIILLALFFLNMNEAGAHEDGKSFEKVINNYKVDIGYDVSAFVVGQPVRFDFIVLDNQDNEVPFGDVWVRLTKGGQTVFASGIHKPELGRTTMVQTFPYEGAYELNVRFENAGKTIVETAIPLTVEPAEAASAARETMNKFSIKDASFGLAGIVIGLALAYVTGLKKHV